jgi:hypothetical protein
LGIPHLWKPPYGMWNHQILLKSASLMILYDPIWSYMICILRNTEEVQFHVALLWSVFCLGCQFWCTFQMCGWCRRCPTLTKYRLLSQHQLHQYGESKSKLSRTTVSSHSSPLLSLISGWSKSKVGSFIQALGVLPVFHHEPPRTSPTCIPSRFPSRGMISPFKSYGRSCGISRKSSSFPLYTIDAPFILYIGQIYTK